MRLRQPTKGRLILFGVSFFCCIVLSGMYLYSLLESEGERIESVAPSPQIAVVMEGDQKHTRFVQLAVGIMSSCTKEAVDQRNAVRESWLKWKGRDTFHRFIVGYPACLGAGVTAGKEGEQGVEIELEEGTEGEDWEKCSEEVLAVERALESEQRRYGDIMRVPVHETYRLLASKSKRFHEWLVKEKVHAEYLLKTDHDVFVRLDTLLLELREVKKDRSASVVSLRGFIWKKAPVHRAASGHKNLEQKWQFETYPSFPSGVAYLLSGRLSQLIGTSASLLETFDNEDTALGIWISGWSKQLIHDPRFQSATGVCFEEMLTKHPMSPSDLYRMYHNVISQRPLCHDFLAPTCPIGYPCLDGQTTWQDNLLCDSSGCSPNTLLYSRQHVLSSSLATLAPTLLDSTCLPPSPFAVRSSKPENSLGVKNLVKNPSFRSENSHDALGWAPHFDGYLLDRDCLTDHVDTTTQERCITLHLSLRDQEPTQSRCAAQWGIQVHQSHPESLVLSGWSRAFNVSGNPDLDYSLYMDVTFQDGTVSPPLHVPFSTGTHDWEFKFRIFSFPKPVREVSILLLFRQHTGQVWFDDVDLSVFSHSLCKIASLISHFLPSLDHSNSIGSRHIGQVSSIESLDRLLTDGLLPSPDQIFFLLWTLPLEKFKLQHRRVVEAIIFHHPTATVLIYSNTLPLHWPFRFWRNGFHRVVIVRYDISILAQSFRPLEPAPHDSLIPLMLAYHLPGVYVCFQCLLMRPLALSSSAMSFSHTFSPDVFYFQSSDTSYLSSLIHSIISSRSFSPLLAIPADRFQKLLSPDLSLPKFLQAFQLSTKNYLFIPDQDPPEMFDLINQYCLFELTRS